MGSQFMRILVTGGAGFIGSNFLHLFTPRYPEHTFINLDKLTYAANLSSLQEAARCPNYKFVQADIADAQAVIAAFRSYEPDVVVHFAAESHVDRSILGPADFIQTNIVGTFNLLEACRAIWKPGERKLFHHVSTDEVFGSLGETGFFSEETRYDPSSPYSASKAASDHLVRAYYCTFGVPVKITNCSNNYGPRQFPEKLIPLMILNALAGKPLPVYGNGRNVRDWLYVEDHCEAIWRVMEKGRVGETYNIGGDCQKTNLEVVYALCRLVAEETDRSAEEFEKFITFVSDRPGHDLRYAIDATRIRSELGWTPKENFESGLRKTVRWYLINSTWVEEVRSGEYRRWLSANYDTRVPLSDASGKGGVA
jgi:dTDP-glucose 4,6-dehydratase